MKVIRWVRRAAAAAIGLAILCVAVLLLVMWREHATPVALPAPTGHFAVGRTMTWWSAPRQVAAWIWYPAAAGSSGAEADYLPNPWRTAMADHQGAIMRTFFKRDLSLVHAHSLSTPPVSPERPSYPVVLLRAGAGAPTIDFTTLAEDLASHGYFVVGFDAPSRSGVFVGPDGQVVPQSPALNVENANGHLSDPVLVKVLAMWTADAKFVVDQLTGLNGERSGAFAGRMDLQRLGMFGHSFGGATALEFCHEDARCKAAVDLDGIPFGRVVTEGLDRPAMFLVSDHSREAADPSTARIAAEIRSMYDRLPAGRLYAVITGANHFSFSDQMLLNSPAAIALLRMAGLGSLDGRRGLAITRDYVRTFFDVQLNQAPAASLAKLASKYPDVEIQ